MKITRLVIPILFLCAFGLSQGVIATTSMSAQYTSNDVGSSSEQVNYEILSKTSSDETTTESIAKQIHEREEPGLQSAKIKKKLDQLYNRGTKGYSHLSSGYSELIKPQGIETRDYTERLIIKFSNFKTRDVFTSSIPSGIITLKLQSLPYIIVTKTPVMYEILTMTSGIAQIFEDKVFQPPEFKKYESDDLKYDINMYNSEGRIGAWGMQSKGYTGKNIKIAILDTGIDATHPDLMYVGDGSSKIINQASFIDFNFDGIPDEGPEDFIGHGTHVAGTAAGNGYHIGVAPDAYLLNAKVCSSAGCSTSWMMAGIEWAILNDADIISMSIGGSTFWGIDALDELIDSAWQEGIVITVAAGNSGPVTSTVESPGIGPRVITVGASDGYDRIAAFSGRGPSAYGHYDPDISAPGDYIFSTVPGGTYDIYGGTSMATPHVAGAVALLLEAHPKANPDTIKANLMANAKDLGHSSNEQGAGLVDIVTTHKKWSKYRAILFPTFNEQDVIYLSPGESFSAYFVYITGKRWGMMPRFKLDRSDEFEIIIDRPGMNHDAWKKHGCRRSRIGQKFFPFTVTAPEDSQPGDQFSRRVTAYFWKGLRRWWRCSEHPIKTKMNLVIEIVQPEDDANTGTDAGDTFLGATEVSFDNYTGYASDIDFYKVQLNSSETYTFKLDRMRGYSDFDLAIYNETGYLASDNSFSYTSGPEQIIFTPETTGYYYIRVDPWSVFLDTWYNMDSTGPYNLWMIQGGETGNGEAGTQVDFLGAAMWELDVDEDGINEYLAITITLDVLSPGLLDMYAWIALDKSQELFKWVYSVAYIENYELTTTGVQEITLLLQGTYVADQNYVGSHVIYELFLGDPNNFNILMDIFDVYHSLEFDSAKFGPVHLQYVSFSTDPIDEDGDGIAEWLEVAVTIEVHETFVSWMPYFTATLYHPDGYFFWSVYDDYLDLSTPGEQTLNFLFEPLDFIKAPSGTLDLELVITYAFDHPLTVQTLHYGWIPYILVIDEQFTVDIADYVGDIGFNRIISIDDYGIDTDGDTSFDYLVLEVSFQIEQPGYYSLSYHPWLWSIPDQRVVFAFGSTETNIWWYDAGDYTIELIVSGEVINGAGDKGPYLVLFLWLDTWEYDPDWGEYWWLGSVDYVQNYETSSYNSRDFDTSGAIFNRIATVEYRDLDGDGEDESVEVLIEFDVSYPGDFVFTFEFYSYPIDTTLYYLQDVYLSFSTTGLQSVSVIFDGRDFYNLHYSGFMEIWLINARNWNNEEMIMNDVFFSYQNALFYVDYELLPGARPPAFIYEVDDFGQDTDLNGLFESLIINVTVNVEKPKDFILILDVYGSPSTGYWDWVGSYYREFTAFDPGMYSILIAVPASDILRVSDDYTNFELWINLLDIDWYQVDFLGPVYTDWYYLSEFEPPATIYEVDDFPEDFDGNGLFERLIIDVTVSVQTPGDYQLMLDVYGSPSTGYWDWVGSYYEYITAFNPGMYSIQITVPASDILSRVSDDYTNFELWINLLDVNWYQVDFLGPVYTDWYYLSDFERPAFIYEVNDFGKDFDGNGLFERLIIDVTVSVQVPGDYQLMLDVFGSDSTGYVDWVGSYSEYLTAFDLGMYSIQITVPAIDILSRVSDDYTNFELWVSLLDINWYQIDFQGPIYTNWYYLSDFELPAFIYEVVDFGEDIDSDGFSESLVIDVTVSVQVPGYYLLTLDVLGSDSTGYMDLVGSYLVFFPTFDLGMYSIRITVPASDILSRVSDDYTNFELWINLLDINGYQVDSLGPVYTDWYYLSDFEVAWIYSLDYYTYDADGDSWEDTIDFYVNFEFYSLSDVDVDVYADIYLLYSGEFLYIETLDYGFHVTGDTIYYSAFFSWAAIADGDYLFALYFFIDGEYVTFDYFAWFGARAYNPPP
ncbi:MAG: S8 family serine peptidase [Candidatus Hodarchaeales archaeon]|jgi:hypothetical protein